MASKIENRLKELGIELPVGPAPVANYVPYVQSGQLVFIAGQIPLVGGKPAYVGILGDTVSVEEGQAAARLCAINVISQIKAACGGNLDSVIQCIRLGGYVSSTQAFSEHPAVVNGASDLMVDVFGDAGRHARFAVGAGSLPLGVPVEIDAIFEIS